MLLHRYRIPMVWTKELVVEAESPERAIVLAAMAWENSPDLGATMAVAIRLVSPSQVIDTGETLNISSIDDQKGEKEAHP